MQDFASKKFTGQRKDGVIFHVIKWVLIALIVFFTLSLISKPVRKNWSEDYLAKGDIYLEQKKYLSAQVEYDKALFLYKNKDAKSQKELAQKAEQNVMVLENFYIKRNLSSQTELFYLIKDVPSDANEAVRFAKSLIEQGEYQLAAVSAKTATEMDREYKDGWLYLGIAQFNTAQNVELSASAKAVYLTSSKSSFEKARSIGVDPNLIAPYLEKIK